MMSKDQKEKIICTMDDVRGELNLYQTKELFS